MNAALIAKQLEQAVERFQPSQFGLAEGLIGQVLSACELARTQPDFDNAAWAERAIDSFNSHGAGQGLHSGVAGMGLVLALYFADVEELLAAIDAALVPKLATLAPTSLREGWAGIALYASVRSQSPSGQRLQTALVEAFAAAALPERGGVMWLVPRSYAQARGVSVLAEPIREFGMVHGMGAALVGLSALAAQGHSRAAELARGALRWVWAHDRGAPNHFAFHIFDETYTALSNGAWCTGDVGVVRGCWIAARTLGERDAAARALELARTLARDWLTIGKPQRVQADRLDLCCGSAAVGQIFRRFHMETSEALFRTVSDEIFADAHAHLSHVTDDGFQFGQLGILTALHSSAASLTPNWDCVLAMSLPQSIATTA